jgi:hypothetical protein
MTNVIKLGTAARDPNPHMGCINSRPLTKCLFWPSRLAINYSFGSVWFALGRRVYGHQKAVVFSHSRRIIGFQINRSINGNDGLRNWPIKPVRKLFLGRVTLTPGWQRYLQRQIIICGNIKDCSSFFGGVNENCIIWKVDAHEIKSRFYMNTFQILKHAKFGTNSSANIAPTLWLNLEATVRQICTTSGHLVREQCPNLEASIITVRSGFGRLPTGAI